MYPFWRVVGVFARRCGRRLRLGWRFIVHPARARAALFKPIPMLLPIQRAGARLLFAAIDDSPLPAALEARLRCADLRSALAAFFRELGIELDMLLHATEAARAAVLSRLAWLLPLLDRIDRVRDGSRLEVGPVLTGLAQDRASIEDLLDRFVKADTLDRAVHATSADLAALAAFARELADLPASWSNCSPAELDSAFAILSELIVAQRSFDALRNHLDFELARVVARTEEEVELAALVENVSKERKRIERSARCDESGAGDALAALAALLDDVRLLADHLDSRSGTSTLDPDEEAVSRRLWAYRRLELHPTATLADIKRAHRRLAKKYHPDRAGSSPEAAEAFRDITDAYEYLMRCVSA